LHCPGQNILVRDWPPKHLHRDSFASLSRSRQDQLPCNSRLRNGPHRAGAREKLLVLL
jgi:hypothetical protein